MSEFHPLQNSQSLNDARLYAEVLTQEGFRETNMQFNIGRVEGMERRGYDLVNPETKERIYVTGPSSQESEDVISGILGKHAILEVAERSPEHTIYWVPEGSRLLAKTLKSSPYTDSYMRSLYMRSAIFLRALDAIDKSGEHFGLGIQDIALTHNSIDQDSDDDVYMTVVPPVKEPINDELDQLGPRKFIQRMRTRANVGAKALNLTIDFDQLDLDQYNDRNKHEFDPTKYSPNSFNDLNRDSLRSQ